MSLFQSKVIRRGVSALTLAGASFFVSDKSRDSDLYQPGQVFGVKESRVSRAELAKFKESAQIVLERIKEGKKTIAAKKDDYQKLLENYVLKYGAAGKPKFILNPDIEVKSVEYDSTALTHPRKDTEYRRLASEVYLEAASLSVYILAFFRNSEDEPNITDLLPNISKLFDHPIIEPVVKTGDFSKLLRLLVESGNFEFRSFRNPNSFFDMLADQADLNQISEAYPELMIENESVEILLSKIEPILREYFTGFPESFPKLVISHSSEDLDPTGNAASSGVSGCHFPLLDKIVICESNLISQILVLSHEIGHIIDRSREREIIGISKKFDDIERYETEIEELALKGIKFCDELDLICESLDENSPAIHRLSNIFLQLHALLESYNTFCKETSKNVVLCNENELHTGSLIEEASAYVCQDLILNVFLEEYPKIRDAVFRIRDRASRLSQADHHGSFAFARKTIDIDFNRDPVAALNYLIASKSPSELEEIRDSIIEYNSNDGISRGSDLKADQGFSNDLIRSTYEKIHKITIEAKKMEMPDIEAAIKAKDLIIYQLASKFLSSLNVTIETK
ncbi:MAG: hypothetical protein KDD56_03520 [Bdellovibrionales bacterium]|nr:hypothetical protein [Bdellovibrionales bacterium]